MKLQTLLLAFSTVAVLACCGEANKPVQTATEYGDTLNATEAGSNGTPVRADSIDNSGKEGLPNQMVPENSSITVPKGSGK